MQYTLDSFTEWSTSLNGASEETLEHQLEMFVEVLQAQLGGPHGYRLRRIILTNFWLYGLQEFEIPHGRLFLAGENASGKSTVLTAALPLALDGDLRPNRLDTFGGRERHMEYYVLGGSESATPYSHERRTSYIALEFEWCDSDNPPIAPELRQHWENGEYEKSRYLTIGISLAGNINASDRIRPLRFLITDGSRLGYDLHTVYETGSKHDKRAFDHARFKQQLEGHGIICDTQAEYERQVSRYLFGFDDAKNFQKLINLLLILRRPNLSSELSFSKVHDYLKQSLRKLSGETTSHVIGTIERIDAIQAEKERIQEAYSATERLHQSQQHLALSKAQLAACEYSGTQLVEDSAQNRVTRLRKDLHLAENERGKAEESIQTLQAEQYQVSGQIKVLEASEGLQVAKQLAVARERTRELQAQTHLQEQSLVAARHSARASVESLERQRVRFDNMKAQSVAHLRELCSLAAEESYWEVAALQLGEALHQIGSMSTETASAPEVPLILTSLPGVQSEERIAWLRHLEELHRQREKLETNVQHARNLETTRFQELDHVRNHFQSAQDRFHEALLLLNKMLEQFTSPESLQLLQETMAVQGDVAEDEALPGRVVEQCAIALNHYRQAIDILESELIQATNQGQAKLNELQVVQGGKIREIEEVKTLYELKLAEPEFTPLRPARHTLARTKLAEQGIIALPLYMLLDFTPDIDCESEEAGRIEYMLEDAGLLDALVVAPSQVAAADALLATEELSDCRLDIEGIKALSKGVPLTAASEVENHTNGRNTARFHGLRFDASVNDSADGNGLDWEPIVTAILTTLAQKGLSDEIAIDKARLTFNNDGTWTHGLLTGRVGGGTAQCIGKTTRLRVRQRELDEIARKQAQLDDELRELTQRTRHYEAQLAEIQEKQAQLRKALPNSGLEKIFAELDQAKMVLDDSRNTYQKARLQTQEARQIYNSLVARLERESNGLAIFASDQKHVQSALLGVLKLKNQAQTLQTQLTGLIHSWEEFQQTRGAQTHAAINETNVAQLYERIRYQALQAQAEEEELQRIAEYTNTEELSERLHTLRLQNELLTAKLNETKADFIRADERANNAENQLTEAEERLQQAQQERSEKQTRFVDLLAAYPVAELAVSQQMVAEGSYVSAAQRLLGVLREGDIPVRKEQLEGAYRDAYNALSHTFNREQPILLEYGPDLDNQGLVLFLNESKCRTVELLEILSERIEMQKMLLSQEETKLFEDFLLHEIAEAIRTAIFEAEEWVQQINKVLSGLPMIGEHYALQWKPPAEYDLTKLGSHLAQHYRLLRKPAQALTVEETEMLMSAFRQEIDAVRLRQQENADINFMDALEQVFDYREWFHFDVLVTPIGGQRQRLTDRVAGTRSGAEQLFALYVPLFAALGALYRSAAPGAPKLLALDEAFDKVSVANTQRIMEFLVSQDFQWIMTGPHISGTGAKIPACARYLMIHEKGSPIATASASFWSDSQSL